MRTSYYLRGEILDETSVLLVIQNKRELLWVGLDELDRDNDPRLIATPNKEDAIVFTIYSNETSVQLKLVQGTREYWIAGFTDINEETEAILVEEPTWLSLNSLETDNFNNALAGVTYSLRYLENRLGFIERGEDSLKYNVRFLPGTIYPLGSCGSPITSIEEAKQLEETWFYTNKCTIKGFTTPNECYVGHFYNYCDKGRYCSKDCKGVCSVGNVCEFLVDALEFECVEPFDPVDNGTGYLKNPLVWIIIAIIVIVAVFSAIILIIYQYTTRGPAGDEINIFEGEVE